MKKIVITGAKGGTGPSLMKLFRESGYRAVGIDLKPCGVLEQDYCQLDLENSAGIHDLLVGATAVIHFGSLPTDRWTSWEATYRNLALGGFNILQAAANLRIQRVVLASSPMIYAPYHKHSYLPIDEHSLQGPTSIYGAVKQNLEALAANYARWQGMAIAALRPQRIVYEGSYAWRFHKYTQDDSAAADNLWAYIDARDVATACLAWVESDRQGFEAFNVAADDVCVAIPTQELIHHYYPRLQQHCAELEGYAGLVNCQKLKASLGWRPQHHWREMALEPPLSDDSTKPAAPSSKETTHG